MAKCAMEWPMLSLLLLPLVLRGGMRQSCMALDRSLLCQYEPLTQAMASSHHKHFFDTVPERNKNSILSSSARCGESAARRRRYGTVAK
ncbi:uncharacterized protein J3D65DRAFT_437057 [Phyllosticta citribraziliensis]|uniref:Secreted protein n=1 Tax=Phyllosticta citribraziliensis TaxID=989973 RepID=A0ABR1LIM8_9PEZI